MAFALTMQAPVARPRILGIAHLAVFVSDLNAARGLFEEFWRGSSAKSQTLSWVNMRVPDGTDYLEFMLYEQKPAPDRRGSKRQ